MTSSGLKSPDKLHSAAGRSEAEAALRDSFESGWCAAAVILVADRALAVSEQYGYLSGEDLLEQFFHFWNSALQPGERLFRWSYSSFVAAPIQGDPAGIRRRFDKFASECIACPLRGSAGRIPLLTGTRWRAYFLDATTPPEWICRAMDLFVANFAG
jgi:hypothetical protein